MNYYQAIGNSQKTILLYFLHLKRSVIEWKMGRYMEMARCLKSNK